MNVIAWIVVLAFLVPVLYGTYAVVSGIAYAIHGRPYATVPEDHRG